jgi:methionyl-tRNA synthetase
MADEFGADVFRYFLLREIPFGQDGDFSKSAIIARVNGDLANGLGNLVSRTLGMVERYRGGKIPSPGPLGGREESIMDGALTAIGQVEIAMSETAFHKALGAVWDFIALVNKYVDDEAPWTLAKEKKEERLDTVLWTISRSIAVVSILVSPFMPESSEEIWLRMGSPEPFSSLRLSSAKDRDLIKPGQTVVKGLSLFPRFEEKS